MRKLLWILMLIPGVLFSEPQTPQAYVPAPPVRLPAGLSSASFQPSVLQFEDQGGQRMSYVDLHGLRVRADNVFSLTAWELREVTSLLLGQSVGLSDILPWTDDEGYALYLYDPAADPESPKTWPRIYLQYLDTERNPTEPFGPYDKPGTMSPVERLPGWYKADLEGRGLKVGTPVTFGLASGKGVAIPGAPFARRWTGWLQQDKTGRYHWYDRYPGFFPKDLSLADRTKLASAGLLQEEIRTYLLEHNPVAGPAESEPLAASLVRWYPGEIQNLNVYHEWYIRLNRGDRPPRDVLFRDIPGLSPLEVQEAVRVLTGTAPSLDVVMEGENLRRYRVQILAFQAYALRQEILDSLKAGEAGIVARLPLDFVMEVLQNHKPGSSKAMDLEDGIKARTGKTVDLGSAGPILDHYGKPKP